MGAWHYNEVQGKDMGSIIYRVGKLLGGRTSDFVGSSAKVAMSDQSHGGDHPIRAVLFWSPDMVENTDNDSGVDYALKYFEDKRYSSNYKGVQAWLSGLSLKRAAGAKVAYANSHNHTPKMAVIYPKRVFTAAEKVEYLKAYAPIIYLDKQEDYYPSSVEYAFANMTRYESDGKFSIKTKESMKKPSSKLAFFGGEKNLKSVPCYAFFVEKDDDTFDLVYFTFYPYNLGKEVADTQWGNHVGDWEHLTIRMVVNTGDDLEPRKIRFFHHGMNEERDWPTTPDAEVEVVDATHVVAYSARGSHGLWATGESHVYKKVGPIKLTDYCSRGEAWHTGDNLMCMDVALASVLDPSDAPYPNWMSDNFAEGGQDPSNPSSGAIYNWGNSKRGCVKGGVIPCRLSDGPKGPISKSNVWDTGEFG